VVDGLRERKKQATRRAISDAATVLFMQKGFDNTSVVEVAQVVGVSAQTVLNYFATKADLFFDENDWYAGPPQAVRDAGPRTSPAHAVRRWYHADLVHRHSEGHLDRLAVYLQTVAASEALRRRRLDDLAVLSASLQTALEDISPPENPWQAELAAAALTSAVAVAESNTARISCRLQGTDLVAAAQDAATSIFDSVADAMNALV
jgi:AcrR family transcriptional regulator